MSLGLSGTFLDPAGKHPVCAPRPPLLGRGVAPLGRSCTITAWHSQHWSWPQTWGSSFIKRSTSDKTRPDSPVPTLQGPCVQSPKRRGSLRFLPPLEVRPSSVAPDPAEARGGPPPIQDRSPLRGTLASSLRSPAEGEGHEGFPPPPRERPRESFFNASRGPSPLP